jgi:hypothetical protein
MKKSNSIVGLLLGLVLLGLLVAIWISRFPSKTWDPRFDEQALLGLTPTAVVQKVGPPSYDPRDHGWKTATEDGPLVLGYFGPAGQTYRVEFRNGQVWHVQRYMK